MKVITISNIKGGSAKSTTAIFLAEALSRRGKTLVIDMDMQADTTDYFLPSAMPEEIDRGNIFRLLVHESDFASSVHKSKFCDIIPGTIDMVHLPIRILQNYSIFKRLDNLLKENPDYDFVVIDTPGSARAELTISILASDLIIVPITPSKWAIRAVNLLLDEIQKAKEIINKEPKICFLPCMFGKSNKNQEILNRLKTLEEFKTLSPILKSESIKNTVEKRKTLKKDSQAWLAFETVTNEILEILQK